MVLVATIDDMSLGAALSHAIGSSVTIATVGPPTRVSKEVTVAFECPKGKWCTAGLVVDCDVGTYNNKTGQTDARACKLCPPDARTLNTSSVSIDDCFWRRAFTTQLPDLVSAVSRGARLSTSPRPRSTRPASAKARSCVCSHPTSRRCRCSPVGTDCDGGATIERLPIRKGFYRLNDETVDVRKCPDADTNCSTTFEQPGCLSTSACIGGTDAELLCAPSLAGPFCRMCDRSLITEEVYYVAATSEAVAHCKACSGTLGVTLVLAAGLLGALTVLVLVATRLQRRIPAAWAEWYVQTVAKTTLKNKAKIVIGFYMIVTKVDIVYSVSMPTEVRSLMARLSVVVSLGMDGVATTPLECMGLSGYVPRLVFYMVFPMVVTVVLVCGVCVCVDGPEEAEDRQGRRGRGREPNGGGPRSSLH